MKLLRYLHTLRYLKPSQVYWRIIYKISTPQVDSSPPPELRLRNNSWVDTAKKTVRMVDKTRFKFLNEVNSINSKSDWNHPSYSKLWIYNLHYFDDLNSHEANLRVTWHRDLINNWIVNNPPGFGNGWEAYPLSIRIVNWVKWAQAGNDLEERWRHSLVVQVRYLTKSIERHLLGNHLFTNAKALIFAGFFFDGDEAQQWSKIGIDIVNQEISEQVLKDGGNFELSTMYHSLFLEDLLDLYNLFQSYSSDLKYNIHEFIPKMLIWLKEMLHPDNEISLFNDAAFDIAPKPEDIFDYSKRLGFILNYTNKKISYLKESGYVRASIGNIIVLMDVARIGPDYLLAHAHADTLTFELSLFSDRVFVNSGTSEYGLSTQRLEERGTKAHNTIKIDNKDSSEVWSGFRVARRAKTFNVCVNDFKDSMSVSASHTGYKRLQGEPIHRRTWFANEHELIISDLVYGTGCHHIECFFHLHPDISVSKINENKYLLRSIDNIKSTVCFKGYDAIELTDFNYHPEFGKSCKSMMFRCVVNKVIPVEVKMKYCW